MTYNNIVGTTCSKIFKKQLGIHISKRNVSHKNMFNNSGPRIDPCDTPNQVSNHELN